MRSFVVGQSARFTAKFRDSDGDLFDPDKVLASVQTFDRFETYEINGGLIHEEEGVFAIDVLFDEVGEVAIKFASFGPGMDGYSESRHRVVAHGPEVDQANEEIDRRSEMIQTLRRLGIPVDESRSIAYIEAAYEQALLRRS